MEQHPDLAGKLAPHLQALSTSSAALFDPLASVLTTLISELASLRAAHEHLQERVSHFEKFNKVSLPHSIPPPPNTTPPESLLLDPELTQPPPPPHHLTQTEIDRLPSSRPTPVQHNFHHQPFDSEAPPLPITTHVMPGPSSEKRLRRRRRSSKRPISDSATSSGRRENHAKATDQTITPAKTPIKAHQPNSSNSSMVLAAVSLQAPPVPYDPDAQTLQASHVKPEPRDVIIPDMKVLPTTPITNEKPKKRRTDCLTNDPVIEGFKNAAAAARMAENIMADQEAENCPPAFRSDAQLGKTCEQCQNLFRARAAETVDPHQAFQALIKDGCSHQERISGPRTPEGYWDLDIPETPTQSPPQDLLNED